jgi:hypothetical protein
VAFSVCPNFDGKHGQGTHCTKMGADKLAENTPNAPKFIRPNCLSKPKSLGFRQSALFFTLKAQGRDNYMHPFTYKICT